MANVEELRKKCNELHRSRREEVKLMLTDWLDLFISNGRVWRAVAGNKRCRPIPIHKYFSSSDRLDTTYEEYKEDYDFRTFHKFLWPNIPEEEILEIIENLGFVSCSIDSNCTLSNMCLVVPAYEKGRPLTFAQKWVRKINHAYSQYVEIERNIAKRNYEDFVSQLYAVPSGSIEICDGYALFKDFAYESDKKMSSKCIRYVRAMMHKDGIENYSVNDEYKGVRVFYEAPQP